MDVPLHVGLCARSTRPDGHSQLRYRRFGISRMTMIAASRSRRTPGARPRSRREIVGWLTPDSAARCDWLRPPASRNMRICPPIRLRYARTAASSISVRYGIAPFQQTVLHGRSTADHLGRPESMPGAELGRPGCAPPHPLFIEGNGGGTLLNEIHEGCVNMRREEWPGDPFALAATRE